MRNLVATPWRWRWEWGLLTGVDVLAETAGPTVTGGLLVLVATGVLVRPGSRRWFAARVRAVVVQHRLRVGMSQCDLTAWSGRLPAIVSTRVVDRGIRVTVWVPAGVDVHDFEDSAGHLTAACWASDIDIARHPDRGQFVVVLVVPAGWR